MAEEEAEQEEEGPPPPPHAPINPLKFLPIVLLFLLAEFAGAWYYVEYKLFETETSQTTEGEDDLRPRVRPDGDDPEAFINLGEFKVNPRGTRARLFVNAEVTLTLGPDGVKDEIESDLVKDRVRDAIIWEFGNATAEQLRDSEGREGVKARMMDRINDFLYEGQVMEVWFGKFTLQALSGYRESP